MKLSKIKEKIKDKDLKGVDLKTLKESLKKKEDLKTFTK